MKTLKQFLITITTFAVATLLFSCASTPKAGETPAGYSIVSINLNYSNLEIVTWPKTDRWVNPYSVKKFAKKNDCFAAMNANPFNMKCYWNVLSKEHGIGIYVDNGQLYLEPNAHYAALAFFKTGNGFRAKVSSDQATLLEEKPDFAMGGFWQILEGDKIFQFEDIKDLRSAAGISQDGETLYLLSAKNMSYMECARILKNYGAYSAMEFDGGSSSQLVIDGQTKQKKIISRNPAVIFGFRIKQ